VSPIWERKLNESAGTTRTMSELLLTLELSPKGITSSELHPEVYEESLLSV